ncbi:TPA: hypothetical protein ACK3Q6_006453 [Burkholderia cepacia]|uniref:Uncharacterized protein n=2 Tax=Burkholderia cepacia complex TaxID=87882 RepID=A0A250LKX8_9BURK|nr:MULTISPECIES: hypothetical protein [Burkholderia]MBA9831141.1 hypothetical protein [Burkholderia contaminans]MBA9839199.1 hypothetical protein [Burkholderia contaminans]MBA9864509.1 hypothetical protein [Burkholderia contaminans]MBA9906781.1 hypothetical protein [Burkholderia contaminans]MBA9929474.1 hypothetical protein [Burkholderia contaminans]
MASPEWIEQAYPLQQITVQVQGTRHSNRAALIDQLETAIARLRAGDQCGSVHDDDFGYRFVVAESISGPSFFDDPAGSD